MPAFPQPPAVFVHGGADVPEGLLAVWLVLLGFFPHQPPHPVPEVSPPGPGETPLDQEPRDFVGPQGHSSPGGHPRPLHVLGEVGGSPEVRPEVQQLDHDGLAVGPAVALVESLWGFLHPARAAVVLGVRPFRPGFVQAVQEGPLHDLFPFHPGDVRGAF